MFYYLLVAIRTMMEVSDNEVDKIAELRDALRRVGREVRNKNSQGLDFDLYKEHVIEVLRQMVDVFRQERMLLELQGAFRIIGTGNFLHLLP